MNTMEFTPMDAASYRALDSDAFEKRRHEVMDELDDAESTTSYDVLEKEVGIIEREAERRAASVKLRNQRAAAVAAGAGRVLDKAEGEKRATSVSVTRDEDPFDTEAYNRAFAEYVTRGKEMPADLVQPGARPSYVRADAFTLSTDNPNFVPTTLANEILEKMQGYGDLWPLLSKANVQGGLDYNVWDFEPEAFWIGEDAASDDQKVDNSDDQVSFKYYMLECKLAQSQLASLVTLAQFQARFPEVAAKAMVKKLEQGYIRGTGTGQMLGVLNDARVPAANKLALTEADISSWAAWHGKVKKAMKKSYRDGVFIMAQGTFDQYIDGMVDANGQPVGRINYGVNGEETYRFMGKTVMTVEDDIFSDFDATADGEAFALFTKPSDYLVNQQLGMRSVRWVDEDNNLVKQKLQTVVDGKLLRPWGTLVLAKPAAATGK